MKKLLFIFVLILVLGGSQLMSQTTQSFFDEADALFGKYVSNGLIDYKSIHNDPSALNSVLEKAKSVRVSESDANTYQAFWINAYNLAVIKGIVDNYPLNSPLDKSGFFDRIQYDLGGRSITLNDIENKLLRAKFDDPRVHFVLVCGALGCPPIIPKAYTPANLETLLQQQTIKAINDSSFIKVANKSVAFSEIFKWYKEDFVRDGQNEIDFLNIYRTKKISNALKIEYYPYNWQLNSK